MNDNTYTITIKFDLDKIVKRMRSQGKILTVEQLREALNDYRGSNVRSGAESNARLHMNSLAEQLATHMEPCFTEDDINEPSEHIEEWGIVGDFCSRFEEVIPRSKLDDGNYAVCDLLEDAIKKSNCNSDPEYSCCYFYFKTKKSALKFIELANAILKERYELIMG